MLCHGVLHLLRWCLGGCRRWHERLRVADRSGLEHAARLVKLSCWCRITTAASNSCIVVLASACGATAAAGCLRLRRHADGNGHVCVHEARRVRLVSVVWLLDLSPASCHSFEFFDLKDAASVDRLDVFSGALTVLLELLVHVQQQLFDLRAGHHVLLIEARADAEMQRLFGLLLLGPLLEAGSLSAKPQLDNLHSLWHVLAAVRDDTLHVAPLGTD